MGEAHSLVVKAAHDNDNTLDNDPQGKDDGQGESHEEIIGQEDDTNDDLQDGRKGPRAAVGQESLGLEGEHKLGNTGKQGKEADKPGGSEQSSCGFGNAENAKDYEQDAGNGQPDLSTFDDN